MWLIIRRMSLCCKWSKDVAILQTAREIEHDCNLELYGAAFNVTCYGSVLPTTENLGVFLSLTRQIEAVIGRRLAHVSGGNSSSIPLLLSGNMQPDINNLRLGEALVLGRETAHGTDCIRTSLHWRRRSWRCRRSPPIRWG